MTVSFNSPSLLKLGIVSAFTMFALGACASKPPATDTEAFRAYEQNNDPLEPWNRSMMQIDQGLDTVFFNPVISVYQTVVPKPGRRGVSNAIRNFRTPITLVNDIFQGEGSRAGTTLRRFLINSTVGLFGLFDVAQYWGLPYHSEDLGQTLAVWGVGEGPYLYFPILGPSGGRDITGYAVDNIGIDIMSWVGRADNPFWWQVAYFGGLAVDIKGNAKPTLEELKASSIDYYTALRSAYRQNRAKEIRNGAPAPLPGLDDFDDEDGDGDPFSSLETETASVQTAALPK
ncbi:MAG: VacJ family lipoprotein [Rhodospirillaceae bacterium]|nr:VacJ family lipoprotein [Rhodospirillaceae bacterium]